jgi:hypothetical protein
MKFRIILPTLYVILYIISLIAAFTMKGTFAAFWSVSVTTPWSLLLPMLLNNLFGPFLTNPWFGWASQIAFAAFNGLIYFFTGWGVDSWLASRKR